MRKFILAAVAMTIAAAPAMAGQTAPSRDKAVAQANRQQARELGVQQSRGHDGMRHGPDGERGRGPGRGMGRPDPARMFAMMDVNRDGSISRAEFDGFHAKMMRMHGRGGPGGRGGPEGRGPGRDGWKQQGGQHGPRAPGGEMEQGRPVR